MQKVFGIFIVCFLLQSCNSNNKNIGVESNELIMYEPSEMTILMRRIYEFNKVVKSTLERNVLNIVTLKFFPEYCASPKA